MSALVDAVLMLVSLIASGAMIFGGVVPFIPQYMEIQRRQSVAGFSTLVCLTLLLANILRILFWFGRWYELPLLAQSVFMIVVQLALLRACVSVQRKEQVAAGTKRARLRDWELRHFWQWSEFSDYALFLSVFTGFFILLTVALLDVSVYVELLGFLSLLIEATIGVPQFWRNFQNGSTAGMSVIMVCCWLSGDIFKTTYFLLRSAPAQFYICGLLQISVDLSIIAQVFLYRDKPVGLPTHLQKADK